MCIFKSIHLHQVMLHVTYRNFGDRCGWFNEPLTDCPDQVTLSDNTTWSVDCQAPSAGQDSGHSADDIDDNRCGITSAFTTDSYLSSDDRVATPGYCTVNTGDIPIECAIQRKPGTCTSTNPGWVSYRPAKALYCKNGFLNGPGSENGCTTIDVMCGDDKCYVSKTSYSCP